MKWGQNKQNRTLWWRQARSISKAHEMMFACCSHSFIKFSVQDFKTWRLGSLSNAARMIFLLGSLKLLETWTGTKLWRAAKAFGTTCRSTHHATYKILFAHCFFTLSSSTASQGLRTWVARENVPIQHFSTSKLSRLGCFSNKMSCTYIFST